MSKGKEDTGTKTATSEAAAPLQRQCGLVRPISPIDGLSSSHWQEVEDIISDALAPQWSVRLVSDGNDVGVIQRRIVEGLYTSEMVIVDVSSRNPNVMFELGMRIAFDKPTVVIKDEVTPYPFDVGPNEYVEYPRDLRFSKIVAFKKRLAEKVAATSKPDHTTFLRSFGSFRVAKIDTTTVTVDHLVLERLDKIESVLTRQTRDTSTNLATDNLLRMEREREMLRALGRAQTQAQREQTPHHRAEVERIAAALREVGAPGEAAPVFAYDVLAALGPGRRNEEIQKWWVENTSLGSEDGLRQMP